MFQVDLIQDGKLVGFFGSNDWKMVVQAFYKRVNNFPNATVKMRRDDKEIKDPKAFVKEWENFNFL